MLAFVSSHSEAMYQHHLLLLGSVAILPSPENDHLYWVSTVLEIWQVSLDLSCSRPNMLLAISYPSMQLLASLQPHFLDIWPIDTRCWRSTNGGQDGRRDGLKQRLRKKDWARRDLVIGSWRLCTACRYQYSMYCQNNFRVNMAGWIRFSLVKQTKIMFSPQSISSIFVNFVVKHFNISNEGTGFYRNSSGPAIQCS